MYVVRIDCEDARKFQAFAKLRDARSFAREAFDGEGVEDAPMIFEVADTDDAEIAVIAVRDGLGIPVSDTDADPALILASMGLGTGLRI